MEKELNLLPFALHDLFVSDARDQPTPLNCCQSLFFSPWSMGARRDEWSKPATHPLTPPSLLLADMPTSDGSTRFSPTRTPSVNPIQRPRSPLQPRSVSATDIDQGSGVNEPQQRFKSLVYQEEQEQAFAKTEQTSFELSLGARKKSRKTSNVSLEGFPKTCGRKRASSLQGQQKGHGEDNIPQKGRAESLVENILDSEKDKEGKRITLYKTEVCRSFEETGKCKFGDRCLFAHGHHELREVRRHPRYKTEVCKSFWEEGQCKYGKRCCFLHMENSERVKTASKESAPHLREKSLKSISKVLDKVVLDEEEGAQHLVNDKFSCPENRRLK